jgi:S-adenosylmethionine decarboxylase
MRSTHFSKIHGDFTDNNKTYNYLLLAAHKAGMTVLQAIKHEFYPQGLTAAILLAESHITIHTYPEEGMAYVDCFTCGSINPHTVIYHLCLLMEATESNSAEVHR